jgi:hypothetical protein
MGFVKELFEGLDKATDILNLGRLIFYTAAGALVVLPTYMIGWLLTQPPAALATQLTAAMNALTKGSALGIICFASIVAGFLIAAAGFPLVLESMSGEIRRQMALEAAGVNEYSFPRNYPLMRNKGDHDYAAWLVSEYYRYVEIATYIPLGFIAGLGLSGVCLAIALLQDGARPGNAGLTATHGGLLVIVAALVLIRYWLWPEVWAKRVVVPTIRTYLSTKRNLIDGIRSEKERAGQHQADKMEKESAGPKPASKAA